MYSQSFGEVVSFSDRPLEPKVPTKLPTVPDWKVWSSPHLSKNPCSCQLLVKPTVDIDKINCTRSLSNQLCDNEQRKGPWANVTCCNLQGPKGIRRKSCCNSFSKQGALPSIMHHILHGYHEKQKKTKTFRTNEHA